MENKRSVVLSSRYTGPGSPWEKAKARAAQHQSANGLNLSADYNPLTKYTGASGGNGYTASRLNGIADSTGLSPANISQPAMNVGDSCSPVAKESRPELFSPTSYLPTTTRNPTDPLEKNVSFAEGTYDIMDQKRKFPCPDLRGGSAKLQYDFLRQTPGISKENVKLPYPEMREPINYMIDRPRPTDPIYQPPQVVSHPIKPTKDQMYHTQLRDYSSPKPPYGDGLGYQPIAGFTTPKPSDAMYQPPQARSDYIISPKPHYGEGDEYGLKQTQISSMPQTSIKPPVIEGRGCCSNTEPVSPQLDQPILQKPMEQLEKTNLVPTIQFDPSTTRPGDQQTLPCTPLESKAVKGIRKILTTNQTYGSWIDDPFLQGKDWYRVPRYPTVKTYLTQHKERTNWM